MKFRVAELEICIRYDDPVARRKNHAVITSHACGVMRSAVKTPKVTLKA